MPERGICWLRRDLRVHDHAVLAKATEECAKVAVVFVYDEHILDDLEDPDDRRLSFIKQSLDQVETELHRHHSNLITLKGKPEELIPNLAKRLGAQKVYAGEDVDPYAWKRDEQVAEALGEQGIQFELVADITVFRADEITTKSGDPYRVYTPYMRAWRDKIRPRNIDEKKPNLVNLWPSSEIQDERNLTMQEIGFRPNDLWLTPGFKGGRTRLEEFLERIHRYDEDRNQIHLEGTSGLSVHLRHGTVSIRECFRAIDDRSGKGAETWKNELIWREFYYMILARFPHVVDGAFNRDYEDIDYLDDREAFARWCEGQTGYPLVDAGMRCLNQTGWMHNRVRMIVASFLTKDLLTWWKKGELYFARKLLDYDLANNNGGWQWAASTGVDAQPYFRIFNPVTQSERFDPDGDFVRKWCPELDKFSSKEIHFPASVSEARQAEVGCVVGTDYPAPLVNHKERREAAIDMLKKAKEAKK